MHERFYFEKDEDRQEFFKYLKTIAKASSWGKLAKKFNLYRTTFQYYQYGKLTIPVNRFNSFLNVLSQEKQDYFLSKISRKPSNWGAKLGGKITFSKYPEILANGRKIAIEKAKERLIYCDFNALLSEELCEFIGAFIGDGHLDLNERNGTVSIIGDSNLDEIYLKKHIPSLVKNFSESKPGFFKKKDSDGFVVNFYSKNFGKFLNERFGFPKGEKTYTVKIPSEVMNSQENFVFATVRGIFDTEGCVYLDKRKKYLQPYPRITFQITSENLFNQLKEFLSKYFSLYTFKTIRNVNNLKNKTRHPVYGIEIYGLKQLEKWMQLIGFSNQRHLSKVYQVL